MPVLFSQLVALSNVVSEDGISNICMKPQTFSNAVRILGTNATSNLTQSGSASFSNGIVGVSSDLNVTGMTRFTNAVNLYGVSTQSNVAFFASNVTVSGTTKLSNVAQYGTAAFSNGEVNVASALNVTGLSTVSNIIVNGTLQAYQTNSFYSNVTIYNTETLQSNLIVQGLTTLSNLSLSGYAGFSNGTVGVSNLGVAGATTLSNVVNIYGASTHSNVAFFSSNLTVTGPTVLSNTLTVSGLAMLSNLSQSGSAGFSNGTVGVSNLGVAGATTLSNVVNIYGVFTNSNAMFNSSNVTCCNLLVTNSLTTSDITPITTGLYNIGTGTYKFKDVNLSGTVNASMVQSSGIGSLVMRVFDSSANTTSTVNRFKGPMISKTLITAATFSTVASYASTCCDIRLSGYIMPTSTDTYTFKIPNYDTTYTTSTVTLTGGVWAPIMFELNRIQVAMLTTNKSIMVSGVSSVTTAVILQHGSSGPFQLRYDNDEIGPTQIGTAWVNGSLNCLGQAYFSNAVGMACSNPSYPVDVGGICRVSDTPGLATTSTNSMASYQMQVASSSKYIQCWAAGAPSSASFLAAIYNSKNGTPSTAYNPQAAIMLIAADYTTNRSINASGTINALGSDYAEYLFRADEEDEPIAKGDVVGIDAEGKITTRFEDSVSFGIKSTDPCIVGGDGWTAELGPRPSDESGAEFERWETSYEALRRRVDRIAFSGRVPVNVFGAEPGDFLVPTLIAESGRIGCACVPPSEVTLPQFISAVGRVYSILEDGRAFAKVK